MSFTSRSGRVAAAVLCLGLANAQAVEDKAVLPLDELRSFADVYNQIRVGYVEEIDDSTLLEYAIQGMLMNLDPHSVYLTEDAFSDLQDTTRGEFSGLGLEVGMENLDLVGMTLDIPENGLLLIAVNINGDDLG